MAHQDVRIKKLESAVAALQAADGGLKPFWQIAQQVSQDYSFAQAGSQAISIPGFNLSEGVLSGKCMCQILIQMMGTNGTATSAIEWFLATIALSADSGGQDPYERAFATDDAPLVELVAAGAESHNSCAITGLTLDATSQIEMTFSDSGPGTEGAWTGTALCSRSVYLPTP